MAGETEWADPQLEPVDWSSVPLRPFRRSFIEARDFVGDCARERRDALGIRIEDNGQGLVPAPIESFEELGVFPDYALRGLQENGIVAPMPIQSQALPLVLSGHDVIGLAQTGSGKTLAFLLPAVVHIEDQPPVARGAATPIVLVLAPTRELAVQISDEATKVLRHSRAGRHRGGVWAACVYGGGNRREQTRNLSWGSQIVVATPGRLIDFAASQVISFERVTYFVLDEADRMLDMGFQGDVAAISSQVRPDRQVLFFSATWSKEVQHLARGLCYEGARPVRIAVGQSALVDSDAACGASHQAREGIVQEVVVVDYPNDWDRQLAEKKEILNRYLANFLEDKDTKILVFVSQKQFADDLAERLWEDGIQVSAMHGGKAQDSRLWTLDRFRRGELQVLVATDVVGRGIDIPAVSHVVVYDMGSVADYVHRIGRTARGKNGKGHALVFFEYYHKEPNIAAELIDVLEASKQVVPNELRRIADEVAQGIREVYKPSSKWGSGGQWGGSSWGGTGGSSQGTAWSGRGSGKGRGVAAERWDQGSKAAPRDAAAPGAPGSRVGRFPSPEPEATPDSWEEC